MDHTAFIFVTAVVLILAFSLGWFTHWLVHRFSRVMGGDVGELDRLAQDLHAAEEMRERAMEWAEQREAEFESQLAQGAAELKAAMEGLRDARAEAEEMRSYIERLNATN